MGGAGVALPGAGRSWFELDFVDAAGLRRREGPRVCSGVAFEDAAPVRAFRWSKGQRNFAGWWWSATTGRHVGYESWLERDHAMLLDFDAQVVAFASQPFWLHWIAGERHRRHAPDFFARRADGTGVVIDVRADERIEPADAEAFAAAERACAEAGWTFRRVGTPDAVLVANVRWLSRYRHPRCGARQEVADRLLEVFVQPMGLFEGVAEVGDRLEVLPVCYHLLWRQVLVGDLAGGPLSPVTRIRRAGGGR